MGGGLQRQHQDREERTNPFKLQKLSSAGHVWLQRMNFDGKRCYRMIEVQMDALHVCIQEYNMNVCVCVLFCKEMMDEVLTSPQGFDWW